ncbi:MAG: GldG family protein [Anaerolineae bacterium]|jgi:hypothetical protein|nr:GldG family protein [Anaerolineae bacterium]
MTNEKQEPLIPPILLLGLGIASILVAITIAFTNSDNLVLALIAAGVGIGSLVGWGFLSQDQFSSVASGRALRFGGTSLLVTLIVIVALIAIYAGVRGLNLRLDVTQQENFSLPESARELITAYGNDPTQPPVRILAFYNDAASRDQATLLFDDFVQTSNNKISYEFVDPDQNPVIAEQYEITQAGQIAVVRLENGQPNLETALTVNSLSQESLTNTVIAVAALGDFRLYVLEVENGLSIENETPSGMSIYNQIITENYQFTTQSISIFDITSGTVNLTDPEADGIVLMIPGGTSALDDESLKVITDYLDGGGDAVIFADVNVEPNEESLATAPNLNEYLARVYGVNFTNSLVLDDRQNFQSLLAIVTNSFDPAHPVTETFASTNNVALLFDASHTLQFVETPPANVVLTTLVSSGPDSYSKSIDALAAENVEQVDTDPVGPFPIAIAAENQTNGSRLVLVGASNLLNNQSSQFSGSGVVNIDLSWNTALWTAGFFEFYENLPRGIRRDARAQDAPILASDNQLTLINFLSTLGIPFGILLLGGGVWFLRRSKVKES